MAPCSRLYGFLGCQLALAYPGASHQYSHWIDTYSSANYLVGACTCTVALVAAMHYTLAPSAAAAIVAAAGKARTSGRMMPCCGVHLPAGDPGDEGEAAGLASGGRRGAANR
jgi:hypothetical protein